MVRRVQESISTTSWTLTVYVMLNPNTNVAPLNLIPSINGLHGAKAVALLSPQRIIHLWTCNWRGPPSWVPFKNSIQNCTDQYHVSQWKWGITNLRKLVLMLPRTFTVFKNKLKTMCPFLLLHSLALLCAGLSHKIIKCYEICNCSMKKWGQRGDQAYEYFHKVVHVYIPIWMLFVCDCNSFKDKQQTQDHFFHFSNNEEPSAY